MQCHVVRAILQFIRRMFVQSFRCLLITPCLHWKIWNSAIGRQLLTTWRRRRRVWSKVIQGCLANDTDQRCLEATTRSLRSTRSEPSPFRKWKKQNTVCCIAFPESYESCSGYLQFLWPHRIMQLRVVDNWQHTVMERVVPLTEFPDSPLGWR